MKYLSGEIIIVGDKVQIDETHSGLVVVNIESGEYSPNHPQEQWEHLKSGVLIDTDFAGLVHYEQNALFF